ncbi:MAG: IS3 family transposase [Actinobacteria bacterium]|nr:IS3 family transposase [Actinomycetota bacterium]
MDEEGRSMKRRRHTPEQVIRKLREADRLLGEGKTVGEVARQLEVSEPTYHRWRQQFGGMKADDVKRLKELARENQRLKAIVADQALENRALKEVAKGKLVSPARRREAVAMVRDRLGVSERRACRYVGQHRSTQRREPVLAADDQALRAALRQFATDRPRWGYRRAHYQLVSDGWWVNRKRVARLWREEGLRVPRRRRKRPPAGDGPAGREVVAAAPDEVWALDFQADQTSDGRPLRLLNVLDEHTRQALVMHADRSMTADETVCQLERLITARGRAPRFLRVDNGPELTSHALRDWCRFSDAQTVFIEPGCPWQNPFVESFHARVRDELLNCEQFACLTEARVLIDDWREDYNTRRPHSSLGMRTPAQFAADCTTTVAAA